MAGEWNLATNPFQVALLIIMVFDAVEDVINKWRMIGIGGWDDRRAVAVGVV